jgi:hypothetical protein
LKSLARLTADTKGIVHVCDLLRKRLFARWKKDVTKMVERKRGLIVACRISCPGNRTASILSGCQKFKRETPPESRGKWHPPAARAVSRTPGIAAALQTPLHVG